jgi:predicted enzyme related to lactoylglutathione lyase
LGRLRKIDCIMLRVSDLEASAEGLPNPSYSFSVDDVTEFCNEYTNRGYRMLKGPFDVRTGKYAVLEDPDGNRVDIIDLTGFGGKPRYDR